MDVINNRFAVLLAEKRMKERRNISLSEVARDTGVSRQTLYVWENNSATRYDAAVMNAICRYFGIEPGDLFDYVDDGTIEAIARAKKDGTLDQSILGPSAKSRKKETQGKNPQK